MADCMVDGEGVVWNVPFFPVANDWEVEEFSSFFARLYGMALRRREDDVMIWTGSKEGVFSVKSMYRLLQGGVGRSFPWRGVWRSLCPLRVSFFVWETTHGRILTIDNLCRRRTIIAKWCFLCQCDGEFVDHVLLHCPFARGLWSHILCIVNFQWVMPEKVADVLWSWKRRFHNPFAQVIWR